jgi:opacity protein-like surface antigen
MKRVFHLLAILLLSVPLMVEAKDSWYDGIYLGAGAGGGRVEAKFGDLSLLPPSTVPPGDTESLESTNFSNTSITSKFFAGYRIFDYLAIEGGYVKFHELSEHPCFIDGRKDPATGELIPGTGNGTCTPDLDPSDIAGNPTSSRAWTVELPMDGWTGYIVGLYPFNQTVEIFGKVGAFAWDMDASGSEAVVGGFIPPKPPPNDNNPVSPTNDPINKKFDGTDLALGIGFNFNAESGITVRTEFEWFDIDIVEESWLLSLSAIYNF